jgi:hypothetical protein
VHILTLASANRENGTMRITTNTRDKGRKEEYVERM